MSGVIGFLASGTEEQLRAFHWKVFAVLNGIDRRGDTVRYTCFEGDRYVAEKAAEQDGVTLEEIVGAGDDEDYRMIVQGEHPGWKNRDKAIFGNPKMGEGADDERE